MLELKKIITKNGQVRYYRADNYFHDRSLPVAKAEAETMLANGEAVLVDYLDTLNDFGRYCNDQRAKEKAEYNKKVIDFAPAFIKKQEQKKLNDTISRFKNEILPNLSQDTLLRISDAITSGNADRYKAEMVRALLEATLNQVHQEGKS